MGTGRRILCEPIQKSHSSEGSTLGRRYVPRSGPICNSPQRKLGETSGIYSKRSFRLTSAQPLGICTESCASCTRLLSLNKSVDKLMAAVMLTPSGDQHLQESPPLQTRRDPPWTTSKELKLPLYPWEDITREHIL